MRSVAHGVHRKNSFAFLTAIFFAVPLCSAIFFRSTAFAAGCCEYAPNATKSPPTWLVDLAGNARTYATLDKEACKPPDTQPILQSFAKYYLGVESSDCKEKTDTQKEVAATKCCIVEDSAGAPQKCVVRTGSATCLSILVEQGTKDGQVVASSSPCKEITKSCSEAAVNVVSNAAASIIGSIAPGAAAEIQNGGTKQVQAEATAAAKTDPYSASQKPWSKKECETFKNKDNEAMFVWSPPKNQPTATVGEFCYVIPQVTKLEVSIGSTSFVRGMGQYISAGYVYVLGFGILLCVLLMMIAGVQWMFSGMASVASDAKEKLRNSLLGLLLLVGSYTLLNTINPQLTKLQLPPMHAIRPLAMPNDVQDCDPTDEKNDSCQKFGPHFHCKLTYNGAKKLCDKQMKVFLAVMVAPAVAAGGVIIAAEAGLIGAGAQVTSELAASNGAASAVANAAGNIVKTKIASTVISSTLFAGGIAALTYENTSDGVCIESKHGRNDGSPCAHDDECVSSQCLIMNTSSCHIEQYGLCVSGKLRQPCDASKDNSCTPGQGQCIDNGHGVSKLLTHVGFCSDGSEVGMPCDGGKIQCKGVFDGVVKQCVAGYCREKGFFDGDGIITSFEAAHPVCRYPTDCLPADPKVLAEKQGTLTQAGFTWDGKITVGCMKPQIKSTPAHMIWSGGGTDINEALIADGAVPGVCVLHTTNTINSSGVKKPSFCTVNFYPLIKGEPRSMKTEKLLGDDLIFSDEWKKGVSYRHIGCDSNDSCVVSMKQIQDGYGAINKGVLSIEGHCEAPSASDVDKPACNKTSCTYIDYLTSPQSWRVIGADAKKNFYVKNWDEVYTYPSFENLGILFNNGNG